ncbi:hypothetical protein CYG49_04990 [Candidatus Saccharibacteria bacterium]|nr:MAG: hypothetical protein CYG49_04990 [Candidatus Saccharibacteria bacterium]
MPIVTAIEPQKRSEQRVNVFLDGSFWVSLDIAQLVDLGIKIGMDVGGSAKEKIEAESTFGKAYGASLNYISLRPRSEKEIRDYAWRKKWDEETATRVVERLKRKGYLNDESFAASWVRSREAAKPSSRRKLQLELRQKGITDQGVSAALANFDEVDALRRVIHKKQRRYPDRDKFIQFLLRQGYQYDLIKAELDAEFHEDDYPSI